MSKHVANYQHNYNPILIIAITNAVLLKTIPNYPQQSPVKILSETTNTPNHHNYT